MTIYNKNAIYAIDNIIHKPVNRVKSQKPKYPLTGKNSLPILPPPESNVLSKNHRITVDSGAIVSHGKGHELSSENIMPPYSRMSVLFVKRNFAILTCHLPLA